ncbi:MAG: RseA family anti-sigma factor [Lysobacterales bacterium]|jgi:sigma-E factor negative regulatory protein RseA
MDEKFLQHLSSMMDGEISRDAGIFLTRRLASDESLCAKWERYHLIRDCIRQPGGKMVVSGLSAKLNATLDAESAHKKPAWRHPRWLRPVSGTAIAASVALMALVFTVPQSGKLQDGTVDPGPQVAAKQPFVSPNPLKVIPLSQPVSYSPSRQAEITRLNAYLLRHNQMAGMAGRQGFVSLVPIVATPVNPNDDEFEDDTPSQETAGNK